MLTIFLQLSPGGMDLLLHLLTNISLLPVTKEMVTSSRLGKAVAALEKHKICVGSLNESSIKSRVRQVKERWSASVKAQKNVRMLPMTFFVTLTISVFIMIPSLIVSFFSNKPRRARPLALSANPRNTHTLR